MGTVKSIYIGLDAAQPLHSVEIAELVSGKGIVGDRYYNESGTFSARLAGNPSREVTLIERENIEDFNSNHNHEFTEADFRRNIVTSGIRLNDLVGKQFSLGSVLLEGLRLCEPCTHLQSLMSDDVLPGLVGKGGLRAAVLKSGKIIIGDTVSGLDAVAITGVE